MKSTTAKKPMPKAEKKIGYVSLFSGGMGLDLGLEKAGFSPLICNEIDRASTETIKLNMPELPVLDCSIEDINGEIIRKQSSLRKQELDLIAGGPPCQSFSVYGNRMGTHDGRGKLIFEYIRLVKELRPKTFLMENVRGLHSMPLVPPGGSQNVKGVEPWMTQKGSLLLEIFRCFKEIGYRVDGFLVNSANYGAPQIRERLVLIGNRFNLKAEFPAETHSNRAGDGLLPFQTLRDAIGNSFIDHDPSIMNFSPRKLHYLSMVPEGGNWRSLPVDIQKESMGKSWYLKGGRSATWRRLSWDFPSPTVVTMPNHASTSMCHPTEVRALTVGECAAIQEFPRSWLLAGKTMEKYRQIGNAVPVRLGYVAGICLQNLLKEISKVEKKYKAPKALIPSAVQHLRPHVRTKRYWHNGQALAGDHSYYSEQTEDEEDLLTVDQ
jgi:DNA (cytosine-5)-methyltransferase 1